MTPETNFAKVLEARRALGEAYQQLAYLWRTNKFCACGARLGSENTHPHVISCPTAKAVAYTDELNAVCGTIKDPTP